jgi:hypothetical protein
LATPKVKKLPEVDGHSYGMIILKNNKHIKLPIRNSYFISKLILIILFTKRDLFFQRRGITIPPKMENLWFFFLKKKLFCFMERNIVSMGGPPPERDQPYMGDKKKICCREKII